MTGPLRAFFRNLLSRRRVDQTLDEEVLSLVDLLIQKYLAAGLTPREARRRALVELGGVEQLKEEVRQGRAASWLEGVWQDLRSAVRSLRRSPAFSVLAILMLALGIGANTAIFSIFNSLVFRPLPVNEPARLVELLAGPDGNAWTYPLWREIEGRPHLFDGAFSWGSPNLASFQLIDRGQAEPVSVYSVSGDFFRVLGVHAIRGRLLTGADDVRKGPTEGFSAVISEGFWRRRFGASDGIVGSILTLDRSPVTIVGIAPPGFFGPEVGSSFDFILPLSALPQALLDQRGFFWLSIMARLKPGQAPEDVTRAMQAAQPGIRAATLPTGLRPEQLDTYLSEPIHAVASASGPSGLRSEYRDALIVILAIASFVLLIACTNIGNLLLARGDARRYELSVRLALGASRGRLMRQLIVENGVLSLVGAALGLLAATWISRLLVTQFSTSTDRVALALPLDWRVLAFATAAAVVTAVAFGLLPALRATRAQPTEAMADRSRTIVSAPRRWSLGHLLVVGQVALSLVLGIGASLLVSTYVSVATPDVGFNPRAVLIATLGARPGTPAASGLLVTPTNPSSLDDALHAVQSAPGVAAAAFSGLTTPMGRIIHRAELENPEGVTLDEGIRHVFLRDAGVGWFDVMGMRVLAGREFSADDVPRPEAVAIVNQTLARRFFGDGNPIGEPLRLVAPPGQSGPAKIIVGVVEDAVYHSVRDGIQPTLYRFQPRSPQIVVRAVDGEGAAVARPVTEALTRSTPDLLVTARPMIEQVRDTVVRERVMALLAAFFGALGFVLAGAGIYGVTAYGVSRRRSEIAVRRALGASSTRVMALVVSRGLEAVMCGLFVGVLASLWLTPQLEFLLYGLQARDPVVIRNTVVVLGGVAILAAWLPVVRALRLDPARLLRES